MRWMNNFRHVFECYYHNCFIINPSRFIKIEFLQCVSFVELSCLEWWPWSTLELCQVQLPGAFASLLLKLWTNDYQLLLLQSKVDSCVLKLFLPQNLQKLLSPSVCWRCASRLRRFHLKRLAKFFVFRRILFFTSQNGLLLANHLSPMRWLKTGLWWF